MTPHRELIRETLHDLAQPITSLRVTVELGLDKVGDEQAAQQSLVDSLLLIDRIMQDLSIFREIASLDEEPPINSSDAQTLLQSSAEEMALVAHASSIVIHLNLEPALMACHAPTLQRAIFVLLDEVIAVASRNSSISISLHPCENEFLLEIRPGPPPGLRQKLCCHLMQLAGGRVIAASAGILATMFQKSCPAPAVTNADAILLPPPSLVSSNTGVQR